MTLEKWEEKLKTSDTIILAGEIIADWKAERELYIAKLSAHKERVRELKEALQNMIVALRNQARLAQRCGGDIAIWEGNAQAWTEAKRILQVQGQTKEGENE
jgi:hypothetical protein